MTPMTTDLFASVRGVATGSNGLCVCLNIQSLVLVSRSGLADNGRSVAQFGVDEAEETA